MSERTIQWLQRRKAALVERYRQRQAAAGRKLTLEQAESELRDSGRQAPIDRQTRDAALAVAHEQGIPFEKVLAIAQGQRPFKYFGAAGVHRYGEDGDPAARSHEEMLRVIDNPQPEVTLNGRSTVIGGRLSRAEMEMLHERLQERRRRGEDVRWADVLREYFGDDK